MHEQNVAKFQRNTSQLCKEACPIRVANLKGGKTKPMDNRGFKVRDKPKGHAA